MTKASNAEPASPEIGGGPVSRWAVDGVSPVGATLVATSPESRASSLPQKGNSLTLWLWVAGGFLLLAIGWAVLFTVAHSAKIESVPLSTSGGGTR